MPDTVSLPATLADLSSLFSNQIQSAAQVTINEANLGLTGLGNLLSQTGLGSTAGLIITTPQLSPITNNTLTLTGAITYLSVQFNVTLNFTQTNSAFSLSFSALQATGSSLSLSLLVSHVLPAANNAPPLTLSGLLITFDTGASTWMLGATTSWSFAVGASTASIQATLGITQAGAGLMGSLAIGPATFTVGYQIQKGSQVLMGTWTTTGTTLGWNSVVTALGLGGTLTIPSALGNGGFNSAQLSIDFAAKQVTLSGQTTNGGAFLYAGQQNGKWGVAIGAAVGNNWKFGQVGLSSLDFLVFQQAYLLASSFPQSGYTFPGFAPMTTAIDVVQGLNFGGVINFASGTSALSKAVYGMLGDSTLAVAGSVGTPQNTRIAASLGGTLVIPQAKKLALTNPQLVLIASPLTAEIEGTLQFALSATQVLDFTGRLAISPEKASFTVDVTGGPGQSLPAPFGFTGVTIQNLGVSLGINFVTPGVDLQLEGIFTVGGTSADKFALEITVDPDAINPILLWGQFSSLSFPLVFNAVCPKVTLPSALSAVCLTNALLYYCEQPTVLPDNTSAQPGFAISGTINAFHFTMVAALKINFSQGMSGSAAMTPIHLAHNAVNVTGHGSLGGPEVDFNTMSSPYLNVTLDASVLDVASVSINGTVTSSGFTFALVLAASASSGNEAASFSTTLNCSFSDSQNFSASATLKFALKLAVGPIIAPGTGTNLGTININTNFSGSLSLTVTSTAIQGSVSGTFDGHSLPGLSFTTPTATLKNIPQQVVNQIKADITSIYSDVLGDAKKWAGLVASGVITGADDAGKVLTGYFNESTSDAQALLQQFRLKASTQVHMDTSVPHLDTNGPHADTPTIHMDQSSTHVDTSITHWDTSVKHTDDSHLDQGPSIFHKDGHQDLGGHSDSGGHTDSTPHTDSPTIPHGDSTPHGDNSSIRHSDGTTHLDV